MAAFDLETGFSRYGGMGRRGREMTSYGMERRGGSSSIELLSCY